MENASKALLIAGSILIVILLIATGVKIFNSTSGTTDSVDSTMQTTETAMFNQKFLKHIKNSASGAQTLSFLNEVLANNATKGFTQPTRDLNVNTGTIWVNYYGKDTPRTEITHKYDSAGLKSIMNQISSSGTYKISISACSSSPNNTGFKNGYILCMEIHHN